MDRIVAVRIDDDGDDRIITGLTSRGPNRKPAWVLKIPKPNRKELIAAVEAAEGKRLTAQESSGALPPKKEVD